MKRTETIFHHPCKDPHTGHWICNTAAPTRFDHHKYERTFYRMSGLAESVERTDRKIGMSMFGQARNPGTVGIFDTGFTARQARKAERAAKATATREANKQKQREEDAAQILSTPERLRSGGHVAGGVPPPDSPHTPRQIDIRFPGMGGSAPGRIGNNSGVIDIYSPISGPRGVISPV